MTLPVRAYTDRMSYEPGASVTVHVDAPVGSADVELVRLLDSRSDAAGGLDRPVDWELAGRYPVQPAPTCVGSFVTGPLPDPTVAGVDELSLGAHVWSGDIGAGTDQTIVAVDDGSRTIRLAIRRRRAVLESLEPDGWSVEADLELRDSTWYLLAGSMQAGHARLYLEAADRWSGERVEAEGAAGGSFAARTLTVGAHGPRDVGRTGAQVHGRAHGNADAKIEAPFVAAAALEPDAAGRLARGEVDVHAAFGIALIGAYDFALRAGDDPTIARPLGAGQEPGLVVNLPARGVTGRLFTGEVLRWQDAPDQYAALHVHSYDLVDAGWPVTVRGRLPQDLPSGVYGVVVTTGAGSDRVPFVVVPRAADERASIALVIPTFSYLAYANESLFDGLDATAMTDAEVTVADEDRAHVGDRSFGLSMYDHHPDGSGVMYSAARRPIVNMRRGYRMWLVDAGRGFSADMYLIEWLERRGFTVDVVTDLEVHERGTDYLRPYEVLISGAHPEYTSEAMLTTLTDYRDRGGRLMYLGGNGWYWVTGVVDTDPLTVEIRRGQAGIRCWESLPGEVTLVSTGEPGGLWRHRGRAPQRLVGVGMAAQGWGRSEPYHRNPELSAEAAWILEGVDEDPIGAYGTVMNGAAGDELDRVDHALGTPANTVVVASSRGHTDYYQRAIEEVAMNLPGHGGGTQDPEVRADIVYLSVPGGGEVFSVGSIAYSGALLHDETRNGISRMTENVLRRFSGQRP